MSRDTEAIPDIDELEDLPPGVRRRPRARQAVVPGGPPTWLAVLLGVLVTTAVVVLLFGLIYLKLHY